MSKLCFDSIDTPEGVFLIYFNSTGIYEIVFPESEQPMQCPREDLPWIELSADLNRYFNGEKVEWERYPLDRSGYRPFTARLLGEVSKIPHGSVITYRQAAELAGSPRAWRAAGQALSVNRHPIIVPCHRVISTNGKPGGFSGPRGWKEKLLRLENVHIKE